MLIHLFLRKKSTEYLSCGPGTGTVPVLLGDYRLGWGTAAMGHHRLQRSKGRNEATV